MYSDNYCGSYKIISVTPKRLLKTQIFEQKGNFPVNKIFWRFFCRVIEHQKGDGTTYRGTQGNSRGILQVISLFL